MTKTIGNPLTWLAGTTASASRSASDAADALGSEITTPPEVRQLDMDDVRTALRKGLADFTAFRSDVFFLIAIYPVIGITLALLAFNSARLPMLFPLAAGFTLLGPVAAAGLYEMSRQRETGQDPNWAEALHALRAHVLGPVLVLALYLMGIFAIWMFAATYIYNITLGPLPPLSVTGFLSDVLTTTAGWQMILLGMGTGFVFAALVLVISLVSFPMLIDRRAGIPVAVMTSVAVARRNPRIVATWGLIVAVSMTIGMLPAFLGLVIVLPVLGHATWHLYRAAVPKER
ncbi:DUF2189 domain-containing protein [Roseovarius sp. 217]|uniref:DUF2189 domain-containing protein n=1 Tax=Roseovarius sp. (strain 217) TaxID=314264 RepID=UPI000068626C|nr:DUF2189 domain-containing protein [Roseovarius sp. 217]EAQ25197.1 hypothetical protein ROS217_03865 [Roseovarius sp. 217]